jgi:hypothetical protein
MPWVGALPAGAVCGSALVLQGCLSGGGKKKQKKVIGVHGGQKILAYCLLDAYHDLGPIYPTGESRR